MFKFLLKVLTLGMFGRTNEYGVLRTLPVMLRPDRFDRPSESSTLKVFKKFFPTDEVDYAFERFIDIHDWSFFKDQAHLDAFLKAMERLGWGEITQHKSGIGNDCWVFMMGDYENLANYSACMKCHHIQNWDSWDGDDVCEVCGHENYMPVTKLKTKEIEKYVNQERAA